MKTIKKVTLKAATKLSQEEMKFVFGGSATTGSGYCATACKDKNHNILKSGQTKDCESKTIRKFCSEVDWKYAICTGPLRSGVVNNS